MNNKKITHSELVVGELYSLHTRHGDYWYSPSTNSVQTKCIYIGINNVEVNLTVYENAYIFYNIETNTKSFLIKNDFINGFYCKNLAEEQ